MRRIASVVVAAGLAAALVACSEDKPNPPPANTANTTGAPAPTGPKIQAPLDLARYTATPCDVLKTDELTKALGQGWRPAPDPKGAAGPACTWHSMDATASIAVVFPTVYGSIGDVIRSKPSFAYYQDQPPIQGHPAISAAMVDKRGEGRCRLVIGATDTASMEVHRQLAGDEENADPCKAAYDMATVAVANIKAKK